MLICLRVSFSIRNNDYYKYDLIGQYTFLDWLKVKYTQYI